MPPNPSSAPLAGACACGKVRFRLEAAPIITHACHCRYCQKASASAFGVNLMIETTHVTVLEGAPEAAVGLRGWTAMRCPDCETSVWSHHPHLGSAIALIGVGLLDEGERLTPEAHYFTRSKHPWIQLPPGVPAFETLGDPGKAGARERIGAALAAAADGGSLRSYAGEAPA